MKKKYFWIVLALLLLFPCSVQEPNAHRTVLAIFPIFLAILFLILFIPLMALNIAFWPFPLVISLVDPVASPYTIGAWVLLIAFVLCLLLTILFLIHKKRKAFYTAAIVFCAVASLADLIVLAFIFHFAAPIAYYVYHALYTVLAIAALVCLIVRRTREKGKREKFDEISVENNFIDGNPVS